VCRDLIGERGEALFRVAITRWCDGRQWLRAVFLGEKEEGLDFEVVLIDSKVFRAVCYVQVKATAKPRRYSGAGNSRRLLVRLTNADAKKLGTMKLPAYVVGIDVRSEAAYIRHVPAGAKKGFHGISCRRPLNCKAIRRLWQEVEDFWNSRPKGLDASIFEG
jgi:hypothetical protein